MRVSTISRYSSALDNLSQRQSELDRAQAQMTGGLRVNKPSDDPTAAARAERSRIVQLRADAQKRSLGVSRNAMSLAESALGQGIGVMQSVREALLAGGNATFGPGERKALAEQLKQLRGQLLEVANQGDGAGGWVFGGQGTTSRPFLDGPSGVAFAGTGGQVNVSSIEEMPTTVDGQQIWLSSRSGNGSFATGARASNSGTGWIDPGSVSDPSALTGASYDLVFSSSASGTTFSVLKNGSATAMTNVAFVPGQAIAVDGMSVAVSGQPANGDRFTITPSQQNLDPFAALNRAIAVLNDPNANGGQVMQAVHSGVSDVDAVMSNLQTARSATGAALTRLDAIEGRTEDRSLWAKRVQSDAEDLDMVQAVSDFQNRQSSYQAALQTYSIVQRLSLFDYIK